MAKTVPTNNQDLKKLAEALVNQQSTMTPATAGDFPFLGA